MRTLTRQGERHELTRCSSVLVHGKRVKGVKDKSDCGMFTRCWTVLFSMGLWADSSVYAAAVRNPTQGSSDADLALELHGSRGLFSQRTFISKEALSHKRPNMLLKTSVLNLKVYLSLLSGTGKGISILARVRILL